jgi:hypothetical protein
MKLVHRSCLVALVLACTASALVLAQGSQAQSRRVTASGRPVAELIQPGDETLVVESRRSRPLTVLPPTGVPQVDWLVKVSDSVLVVTVDDVDARLTDNESWIKSRVTATVGEVLKAPASRPVQPGERVGFEQDGGQLVVAGKLVKATVPWATPVEPFGRYLVFASVNKKTKELVFDNSSMYEITGAGRLRKLLLGLPERNGIDQSSDVEVLGRIRELASAP